MTIDGPLPTLRGFRVELRLLFQNLIDNPMKFVVEGRPPEIRVSAAQRNGCWEFAVEDNGPGVPEVHRAKVFRIFQRLHVRDQYEGTGIGLSHARKIVELHGGKIWVEDSVLGGAAFKFQIREVAN